MIPPHTFAMASRDELWSHGRLLERRLSHGVAHYTAAAIDATDARDDELAALAAEALARLHEAAPHDARVRMVATTRRVAGVVTTEATMVIARAGLSIVTDATHAAKDIELLDRFSRRPGEGRPSDAVDRRPSDTLDHLPLVWRHGTASVLLHEAAGHAAEHGHPALDWPSWLSVRDEPLAGTDDVGAATRAADLLAGESPSSFRRESFRDVPLRRMSSLVVRQHGAPFELPERRIEIELLSGGVYEPLTGHVLLFVAAASLVDGTHSEPLAPFRIARSRESIAQSLLGAEGEPLRYPGVICSSEGQELLVASAAPTLVTAFR